MILQASAVLQKVLNLSFWSLSEVPSAILYYAVRLYVVKLICVFITLCARTEDFNTKSMHCYKPLTHLNLVLASLAHIA